MSDAFDERVERARRDRAEREQAAEAEAAARRQAAAERVQRARALKPEVEAAVRRLSSTSHFNGWEGYIVPTYLHVTISQTGHLRIDGETLEDLVEAGHYDWTTTGGSDSNPRTSRHSYETAVILNALLDTLATQLAAQ